MYYEMNEREAPNNNLEGPTMPQENCCGDVLWNRLGYHSVQSSLCSGYCHYSICPLHFPT